MDHVFMFTQVISASTFSANPRGQIIRQMVLKGKEAFEDTKQFDEKIPPLGGVGVKQRISETNCGI